MELPEKLYGVIDGADKEQFIRAEIEPADCLQSASDEKIVGEYVLSKRLKVVGVARVDIESA